MFLYLVREIAQLAWIRTSKSMVFQLANLVALVLIACVKGQPGQISLTATNSITFVYVDNARKFPLPNAADWQTVDTLPIDTYSRLVAVRASNILGSCSGLLVAISDHPTGYSFVSDNKWVCSANPASGWEYLGFDDSTWTPAHQVGRNGGITGGCSWSTISDIPDPAYWIWTSNHTNGDNVVSCRGYTPLCDYSPCLNGGTCNRNTSNLCNCPVRWAGQFCEIDVTDCGSNPCQNGGTCIFRVTGGYQCDCDPGYSGSNCEIDIKVCDSSPCQNGGSCIFDVAGGYRCACVPGFSGLSCEIELKVCDSNPCQSGGTCIIKVDGGYYCDCAPGFSGANCEPAEITICTSELCLNGATCTVLDDESFTCECAPGYTGQLCETELNECESQTCQHDGTCIDEVNGFRCVCTESYTGAMCETDICYTLSLRSYPILIQQRVDYSNFFNKTWSEMLVEQGSTSTNYWIGLTELSDLLIAGKGRFQLLVNLTERETGAEYYAKYDSFSVGTAENNFTLSVSGHSGTADDALSLQNQWQFSTIDVDNDGNVGDNTAARLNGAWWYTSDCKACLNTSPEVYFYWVRLNFLYLQKDSMYLACSKIDL